MKKQVNYLKDKLLAELTKRRKEKIKINKIRKERGDITTDINEIQIIFRYYSSKLENQEEIHKFLDIYDQPILN
jgi:hypothetical protein